MGNTLCKNRSNLHRPKNPVDRVIGQCAQICPQSFSKKKHFWDKQVLETSPPPLCQQPKPGSNGWQTVTLSVPENLKKDEIDQPDSPTSEHPVAPPRKKRHTKQITNDEIKSDENLNVIALENKEDVTQSLEKDQKIATEDVKITANGYLPETHKDITSIGLLENEISVRNEDENENSEMSKDEVDYKILSETKITAESLLEITKKDIEISDVLSKVSLNDGENDKLNSIAEEQQNTAKTLSSNENVVSGGRNDENALHEPSLTDELNNFEESKFEIFTPNEDLSREIIKETGNLIFSLENQLNDKIEEQNPDSREPVQEEVIVPIRRTTRHICDDDDHLHNLLPKSIPPDPVPPKKPQRDFARYRKSLEKSKSVESVTDNGNESDLDIIIPPPGFSADSLEDCTDRTIKKSTDDELCSETDTIPVDDIEANNKSVDSAKTEMDNDKPEEVKRNMTHSEKILRRCLSSQSYLTPDLIEKIAEQASNLSMSDGYLPEDFISSCNDGSGLVSPNFKLRAKRPLSSQLSESTSETITEDAQVTEDERVEPSNKIPQKKPDNEQKHKVSSENTKLKNPSTGKVTKSDQEQKTKQHMNGNSNTTTTTMKKTLLKSASVGNKPSQITPGTAIRNASTPKTTTLKTSRNVSKDVKPSENLKNGKPVKKQTASTENGINGRSQISSHKTPNLMKQKSVEKQPPRKKRISLPGNNNNSISKNSHNNEKMDISKSIREFLSREDISPGNVLKLLEDEFGDLLFSQTLSLEDRKLIQELKTKSESEKNKPSSRRNSATIGTGMKKNLSTTATRKSFSSNGGDNNINISNGNNKKNNSSMKSNSNLSSSDTDSNDSNNNNKKNCKNNNDNHKDGKDDKGSPTSSLKSASNNNLNRSSSNIPVLVRNKTLDGILNHDKRRHSIDELDSWFSPKTSQTDKEQEDKFPERKRKREVSLPNCLEPSPEITLISSPLENVHEAKKVNTDSIINNNNNTDNTNGDNCNNSNINSSVNNNNNNNDHSPLLKFLENEKNESNLI